MANTLNLGTDGNWATKENSLLGYNSENGNYKPLPFDFTRASSATVVNKAGLIETVQSGIPRIDFLGNTNGALLLEPQRTNLITYSEDFTQGWNLSSATIVSNSTTSPDGLSNGSTLTTTVFGGGLSDSFAVSDGNLTFSLFVKKGTVNGIRLRIDAATDSNGFFDLVNNTVYSSDDDASIESYGNDWYKISISANITTFSKVAIYTTDGTSSYDNGSVYIYGAQLEQGSYPTSYIPTSGSAVTRVLDSCSNGGNEQVINSTEGVLYFNAMTKDSASTSKAISISNGSNTILSSYFYGASINVVFNINGVNQFYANFSITIGQEYKIAILYQENNFALYVDGVKRVEETNGSVPSINTFNTLNFAQESSSNFYGNVKDVRVYNTALTDEELQALTTI